MGTVSADEEVIIDSLSGKKIVKLKTLGKLLDDKITVESLFTTVLYCNIKTDDEIRYGYNTQSDGNTTAKSPEGMFEERIPNDLNFVCQKIREYDT